MEVIERRLEFWAQKKPNEIALIDGEKSLTWAEWNSLACSLANYMESQSVDEEDVVALRMTNRWEWVVSYAAAAKIGCSVVGLNWRLTPSEIEHILETANATGLICDDVDLAFVSEAVAKIPLKLCLSTEAQNHIFELFSKALLSESIERNSQKDPKLIIFTSGTTGQPKGVVTGQVNAKNPSEYESYVEASKKVRGREIGNNASETVLITMPMHHAAGPAVVRSAISSGGKLVLARRFHPEETLRLIQEHSVTTWNGVPTMYSRISALPKGVLDRYDVSSIRSLSVGAAPVAEKLKRWVIGYFGNCLREGYGSTETGMVTVLEPNMQFTKGASSGKPYPGCYIKILDEHCRELPLGETGEIWVRTPVTISSYLGNTQSEETFIDEDGFLRTGDVGHLDAEGYLYITDRSKDLIISGGVNIYPAEIESVLLDHASVLDAAVVGIPNSDFGEEVKAFCEIREGHNVSEADLLKFVEQYLASYKRPRSIELVADLPRNSMGKVMKRLLREPFWRNQERKL